MPGAESSRTQRPESPVRLRTEHGTVLVLVPALTLALLCLGTLAIDLSLVHAVHRDAHRIASVAAADAAAMFDERELQVSGALVVDRARAERVVLAHLAAAELAGRLVGTHITSGEDTVDVTLTLDVPHVLLPTLPGRSDTTRIVVSARGRLHR